ncbi:glycosyltransferase family 25 protein [Psychrobacter sp. VH5]|uniref:glycosyltransferase family 25 protein n=1 Tax=Psychrobacter sp. VH5 TaxID=3423439 RepID=UPI003D6529DB
MKSIVISLKSAIDRRQHIIQEFQNHHIDFEFFDALTPDIAASYAKNLPINLKNSSLTGGELACMMSHVSVWQKMIDEQIPYLAIFEDDVYLGEDAELLLNSSDWINPEWHIVKIEAFTKKVFVSSNRYPIESTNRYITQLKGENLGTAGYILSLHGAQKYLDYLAHHQLRPLDELMFDDFIACGSEPVYQMMPALCIQEMLLNKETPALPSALIKERKDRMHSEKKTGLYKVKRETSRLMRQAKKTLFAKELIFK